MNFLNVLFGFIYALCPLVIAFLFSLIIYSLVPNFVGIMGIVVLVFLSGWLGVEIFKRVQINGFIEFNSALYASPDLDNLHVLPNNNVSILTLEQLIELINQEKNRCKGGTLRIYGDWIGNPYSSVYKIQKAEYETDTKELKIFLQNGTTVSVYNPSHINESYSYLKIIDAEKVVFSFKSKNKEEYPLYFLSYQKNVNKVITETNLTKHSFDVFPNKPALMFFN